MYKNIITFPKTILVIISIIVLSSLYFAKDFKLDASADTLLLENDPDLKYLREINERYGSEDFFILTYEPKGPTDKSSILELEKFTQKINELEWVSKTISVINAPLLQSTDEPLIDRIQNLKYITNPEIDLDTALNELTKSSVYKNLIISSDAKTFGIVVYLKDNIEYLKKISEKSQLLTVQQSRELNDSEIKKLDQVNIDLDMFKKKTGTTYFKIQSNY